MNSPFKELTIERLNDCRFVGEVNGKLQEAVESLHAYREKYGPFAQKAKATVKIEIEIECVPCDVEPGQKPAAAWGITTKPIEVKKPKDHPKATVAIEADGEDGKPKLFVQASGSFDGDPRQLRMTTEDGRAVDPLTGEIMESLTEHVGVPSVA